MGNYIFQLVIFRLCTIHNQIDYYDHFSGNGEMKENTLSKQGNCKHNIILSTPDYTFELLNTTYRGRGVVIFTNERVSTFLVKSFEK